MTRNIILLTAALALQAPCVLTAQTFLQISSTEGDMERTSKVSTAKKASSETVVTTDPDNPIVTFRHWGTCFNELGWDALNVLDGQQREDILSRVFAPDGDLRYSMGRITMNANDYSRSWYSCDEVPGDFRLKYFNIDRDLQTAIPYIHAAQRYNAGLVFWMSPWCPPSWMKINQHYAVKCSPQNDLDPRLEWLMYEDSDPAAADKKLFPKRMIANDFFIQDPRYLQAYADCFCRFIDAYRDNGIDIGMVMYQNEAYSYTSYPGCAWTADGILRFNLEYLAPTLRKNNPGVELYLGTINTNRYDHVSALLSDTRIADNISGMGFQWEGGQILPRIRGEHPEMKYMATESECGRGTFDWPAAEHTFRLINHYVGNGCSDYVFWNLILCDDGESRWGWKQNALIRVDSKTATAAFTPEYFAVKHYSHYIPEGSKVVGFRSAEADGVPVLVLSTPAGKTVVVAGNLGDGSRDISIQTGRRYLNVGLKPHSFNTFVER